MYNELHTQNDEPVLRMCVREALSYKWIFFSLDLLHILQFKKSSFRLNRIDAFFMQR